MKVRYMNFYNTAAMKIRIIIILAILGFYPSTTQSQNPDRERLEAYKIAFFTKRLNLTPGEAERFWPLYNNYQEKKLQIQQERVKLTRTVNQPGSTLSDKELIAAGDRLIELQVAETELAVTFHQHLKEVLPPIKVIRLYQAENQYRMQLLNQLQLRRSEKVRPAPVPEDDL
jgi:hypothetical protein